MLVAMKHDTPPHELPRLPYAMDGLQPYLSKETLEYHYGRHHRGYVDKLNALVRGTDYEDAPLETVIKASSGALFNNAAQVWNHSFYWRCLSPDGGAPSRVLAKLIASAFGSIGALREAFRDRVLDKFGSGWTWLVRTQDHRLLLVNTDDAENPLKFGAIPLIACDVWEHAYYIDFRNARPNYVDAYLKSLVNWDFAAKNLK